MKVAHISEDELKSLVIPLTNHLNDKRLKQDGYQSPEQWQVAERLMGEFGYRLVVDQETWLRRWVRSV